VIAELLVKSELQAGSFLGERFSFQPLYAPAQSAGRGAGIGSRVLVVEDDFLVAIETENALLDAGFAVVGVAASADEAVKLARQERPDLAVMDIRLLGKRDGIDAAIDIFNETGIRCIFATAHSDAATRGRAQIAQPLGWLSKPYDPAELIQAVRDALSGLRRS
jgi:two-component system, response regulator PdtaR